MTLKELKIGESAVIDAVGGAGALRQHFLDMGLIPGEKVTLVKFAPMGDPMELQIHGYELTLRLDDAAQIEITPAVSRASRCTRPAGEQDGGASGSGRRRALPHQTGRASPAGWQDPHLCAGGQPELRQDDAVQPAHRLQPACGQLPRRHGGPEGAVPSRSTRKRKSPTCPASTRMSPYTSEEIVTRDFIIERKARPASSTSWTPPTSSATCT